jgi:aerobic-type carbon monoxide dehydrogenase small subunit (CoxS/CutS family)
MSQCGYCTSGMLMSCAALHEKAKAEGKLAELGEADVRAAIAGNLCRCGAYPHIISAALAGAKGGAK